ncbi:MAG TPA: alpha/beta hydrolase [Planctomycetaceae bacterium]|nr:alpha/beta hydrolase [Planctomycetaceae bacterium]
MTSGPTIVLLPGLDGTGRMFGPFVERCPRGWDTQIVSYPRDPQLGYAELLPLVLDALPTDRPYILLGESFSGPLVVQAATRDLPGLCGVILCATFANSPTVWYLRWWHSLFSPGRVAWMMKVEAAASRLLGFCTRDLHDQVRETEPDVCFNVLSARIKATMTVDVTEELQRVTVPMMYLGAKWDLVVPSRCRKLIEKLRPDMAMATVAASHRLLQNCPDEAWNAVMPWMTKCLGSPATPLRELTKAA